MSTQLTPSIQAKTIAVLGANGRLSREVARAFHAAGWQVCAITRNGKSPALANLSGMTFAAADAIDRDQVITATEGCDVVFNGLNPPYTDWADKAMPMAENAIAAAKTNGAVHLFPGNVYNFGSGMPATLTPDIPYQPDHRKGQIRLQMEEMFTDAAKAGDVQTIILRAGDFFGGDGTGSWFDLVLASKIAKGKFTYPGNRNIIHAWAYLPDLAKAFVGLADNAAGLAMFETFHFEGHNVTGDAMHQAAEAAMGCEVKRGGLPPLLVRIGGLFRPMMREVGEVFYLWTTPHAMKDERLTAVIGKLPHTPLDEAVRAALAGQGWLKGPVSADKATRSMMAKA